MCLTSVSDGLHLLKHLTELQQVGPVSGRGLGLALVPGLGPRGQPRPLHLLGGRGPHLLRLGGEGGQGAV